MNPLCPIIFNSRRTINLYGDLTADLAELAAHREFKQLDQRMSEFMQHEGQMRFKNLGGSIVVSAAVPAYAKVVETFWKAEDLRLALHARLQT